MNNRDIACDGCGHVNFVGRRYKCLRCINYDLCGDCYDNGIISHAHVRTHPMQLVLDRMPAEANLTGEQTNNGVVFINSYKCPYCGTANQTTKRFIDHVNSEHKHSELYVICPICVLMSNAECVLMRNLSHHLQLAHSLRSSINDSNNALNSSNVRLSRRAHHHLNTLTASNIVSTINELQPDIDLLVRLAETRRSRLDYNLSLPEAQRIPLDDATVIQEHAAVTNHANAAVETQRTKKNERNKNIKDENADKLLLTKYVAQKQKKLKTHTLQALRIQHGYFMEQLLLSALAHDELTMQMPVVKQNVFELCPLPHTPNLLLPRRRTSNVQHKRKTHAATETNLSIINSKKITSQRKRK